MKYRIFQGLNQFLFSSTIDVQVKPIAPQEAVAIYLGTSLVSQVWDQLYREPAQGAMAKLDNKRSSADNANFRIVTVVPLLGRK